LCIYVRACARVSGCGCSTEKFKPSESLHYNVHFNTTDAYTHLCFSGVYQTLQTKYKLKPLVSHISF